MKGSSVLKYSILFSIFFLVAILGNAQTQKDSIAGEFLVQVRKQIEEKKYTEANVTLKKLFSLKTVLPDEVAFRYGQIQLGLGNYAKAMDAFKRYIDLTDGKGEYVEEAKALFNASDEKICKKCNNTGLTTVTDSCAYCKGKGVVEITCESCHGKGLEYCTICRGQGVVYRTNSFGGVYQTCTTCGGKGISTCRRCNGTGKDTKFCAHCKGRGYTNRTVTCDHK